ncbi:MAG: hypothetical protein IJ725_05510 [Ruminococcus sp.]|nr:hypothetical protein [Ruminococcus sp.]MBR1880792.1 hypothetical protein [Prevotella sp.]
MDNNEKREGYEISLKDLFEIFKQGLWIMILAGVLFGVVAFGYSRLFIPKTYTASVKLYVETSVKGDNSYSDLSAHNLATSLVGTYIAMLETNNFNEKLSENLDGRYTASQLNSMVEFYSDSDEEIEVFTARVAAKSPTEAKLVADSVADVAPGIISSLKDNTELRIVDNAIIPTKPSSPNVTRNTLIAAAVGFFLALIYVFAREALDNKIKYNPDITEINDIPILSAIPDFAGQKIILDITPEKEESEAENG